MKLLKRTLLPCLLSERWNQQLDGPMFFKRFSLGYWSSVVLKLVVLEKHEKSCLGPFQISAGVNGKTEDFIAEILSLASPPPSPSRPEDQHGQPLATTAPKVEVQLPKSKGWSWAQKQLVIQHSQSLIQRIVFQHSLNFFQVFFVIAWYQLCTA